MKKAHELKLVHFPESYSLLSSSQFGFRKGLNTDHALHSIVKDIHEYVIAIFLYVKQTFYSVDRTILLENLKLYGIYNSDLNWFDSHLSARLQYVVLNSLASNSNRVDFGVPQGRSVSPNLFFLFKNNRIDCSNNAGCVPYADWEDVFNKANTVLVDCRRLFQAN